ncbi:hypothetical protein GQ464_002400 [Rhodocaloribacter litoris]|uniref:hypothetical protein n=1 Tax=Rhodocaloribacter litoris TaxID=2558931 RepID=UPI0014232181|nr:hypothetical protein [Rhodocaloribacter litoris]QXD15819.1 hypothetical protein GQ464_002400 [Rhodocaloribacter litoris]
MTWKENIEALRDDPAGLERLYRSAQAEGEEAAFREALGQCVAGHPGNLLLEAWAHRLGLAVEREPESRPDRHWPMIIGTSVLLGVVSALLAGGRPPVPDPNEASTLFWVGWGPLVALGLLAYLAWSERPRRVMRYVVAAAAIVLVALFVGLTIGDRTDDVAVLGALHLPFVAWALVGGALCLGYPNPARQAYAYLVKSVEVVLTGGIFFGAGMAFVGLTYGIFLVLGVELPEEDLQVVAAWAAGALPLLALGSVYDASVPPAAQDERAGLTRTLRILARLLLPLALGVLLVYLLWFLPVYFRKPFEEREVLIVYNVTILAIMVLLTVVVSGPVEARTGRGKALFRYAVLGLGGLTLILNVYALAAVASRLFALGLTPNRLAVVGWNVTTLLILASVGVRLWKARRQPWIPVLRASTGLFAPLAALWALLLLLVLPLLPVLTGGG